MSIKNTSNHANTVSIVLQPGECLSDRLNKAYIPPQLEVYQHGSKILPSVVSNAEDIIIRCILPGKRISSVTVDIAGERLPLDLTSFYGGSWAVCRRVADISKKSTIKLCVSIIEQLPDVGHSTPLAHLLKYSTINL